VVIGLPFKEDWILKKSPNPSDAAPHMVLVSSATRGAEFIYADRDQ